METPFYGHVRQYKNIQKEIDANMQEVLMSGNYVMGPMLKKFEKELAEKYGFTYAIGVGNGTDAIWLSLMALGVGPGDEVITNANTFFATAEAAWIAGATVVLVDCTPDTRCIDPEAIKKAITPKTKCIIPVHLYGQCADMVAINAIVKEMKQKGQEIFVIEDNAQAIDAAGADFKQGQYSNAMATSFIIQKNLGTFGDGGAVFTNDKNIMEVVMRLRNHGSTKREHHSFGFNSRLDDIHAAILSAKLKHITDWSNQRIEWAKRYTAGLQTAAAKGLALPTVKAGYRHVFHLYVVETKTAAQRESLLKFLVENKVDAKTHYAIAIHQQEGYPWGKEARISGSLANAEKNASTCISLPMFPELTAEEIDYAISKVNEWCNANL